MSTPAAAANKKWRTQHREAYLAKRRYRRSKRRIITDEVFVHTEFGCCTRCGFFSGYGTHTCPDGTVPVDATPRLTNRDMRDLFEDCRKPVDPNGVVDPCMKLPEGF